MIYYLIFPITRSVSRKIHRSSFPCGCLCVWGCRYAAPRSEPSEHQAAGTRRRTHDAVNVVDDLPPRVAARSWSKHSLIGV